MNSSARHHRFSTLILLALSACGHPAANAPADTTNVTGEQDSGAAQVKSPQHRSSTEGEAVSGDSKNASTSSAAKHNSTPATLGDSGAQAPKRTDAEAPPIDTSNAGSPSADATHSAVPTLEVSYPYALEPQLFKTGISAIFRNESLPESNSRWVLVRPEGVWVVRFETGTVDEVEQLSSSDSLWKSLQEPVSKLGTPVFSYPREFGQDTQAPGADLYEVFVFEEGKLSFGHHWYNVAEEHPEVPGARKLFQAVMDGLENH